MPPLDPLAAGAAIAIQHPAGGTVTAVATVAAAAVQAGEAE